MLRAGTVIALDTTRALLSHIEGVQMTMRVRGSVPPSVLVHQIDERDGALVLRLGEPGDVGRILAECQSAGCEIEDLEVGRADLEDVFLQLMAERAEFERIPELTTA